MRRFNFTSAGLLLLLISSPFARSQTGPVIASIREGASFQADMAQGGWFTIKGTGLATTSRTWAAADFQGNTMPTTLDGVTVKIDGAAVPLYYISPTQLNALAPVGHPTGVVTIAVTTPQGSVSQVTYLSDTAPAFFRFDPAGQVFIAAVHTDGTLAGPAGLYPTAPNLTTPVQAKDRVMLFGSGWGITNPQQPDGQVFNDPRPFPKGVPTLTIGRSAATVEFAGAISPGLYQFNIVAPDLPAGNYPVSGRASSGSSLISEGWLSIANPSGAPAPVISSIAPVSFTEAGTSVTVPVTVVGQNLLDMNSVRVWPQDTLVTGSTPRVTATGATFSLIISPDTDPGTRYFALMSSTSTKGTNLLPITILPAPLSVSSVSSTTITAGTPTTISIRGTGLETASSIEFVPPDDITVGAVTASNLSVSAAVSVKSTAVPGARQVFVDTPGGRSSPLTIQINAPGMGKK